MCKLFLRMIFAAVLSAGLFGSAFAVETVQLGSTPTGVKILSQDQNELVMQIDIGSVDFRTVNTSDGDFVLLTIDGFTRSHNIGEPNLPMVNRILSVPFDCELETEVLDYDIEEISLSDLQLTNPLIPVQPSLSKSESPEDVPFEYNLDVYRQAGYYSLPLAQSSILGTMRALHMGMVSIAPVEYNPTENTIRVYKHLTVRVSYLHPDWAKTEKMQRLYHSPFFTPIYNRVINYEKQAPMILDDLVTYPVKYLIISDRMFEDQLQPLIEWKIKKGFNIITAYTDDIGYSTYAIKNYIQDIYYSSNPPEDDPVPSFVLLVGDTPQIPTFDGNAGSHVTDLRYCEFTGDDFPEIYYGRFSAQDESYLQPQIDKTLEYEQYTMPDPSYLGEVTLISGVDYYYAETHGNGQINYGTNLYFNLAHGIEDHTWLYPQSDDPGASAAIIQTVNEGVGFINYTAHCGHSGFGDPSFTVSDIYNLTNDHKYLLGIGNCCLSNTFDESTPCFGEAWLQASERGGVGYIGASNSTYWDEDYWWGVGYGPVIGNGPSYEQTGPGAYDGIFHDHGEPVSQHYITNDAVIFAGNMGVTESGSGLTQYYWEAYHLMGDPSVMTYFGVPSVNNVEHDETVMMTAPSFTVLADPGSYVGISVEGVVHGAGYVDETGMVEVQLIQFEQPGTADIVITAQNRQPYTSTIVITAPDGSYVVVDSCTINDSAGNNNGLVDYGESILLGMTLVNVGPDEASDVTAILSTEDEYTTITDDTESFGNIAGDFGYVNVDDAYAFDVSFDVPDGHLISFELEITGNERETWTSHFTIPVYAIPSLQVEPTYYVVYLDSGGAVTHDLTISNAGGGSLDFYAEAIADFRTASEPEDEIEEDSVIDNDIEISYVDGLTYYNYVGPKVEYKDDFGDGLITDFGGPDEYGYRWIDSDEPDGPTYNWIDITDFGIPISGLGDDTNVGPFDIGFNFPFYGNTFSTFRFCTNGWISFTSNDNDYSNQSIPGNDAPFNLVAPFWDDLNFNSGGNAYYLSRANSLVISYINVPHWGSGGPYTFQIILSSNGDIAFQYALINSPANSNTIGIQNENGSDGLEIAYNESYAEANLAILIKHPIFWLSVSPEIGSLPYDESTVLGVLFNAADIDDGTYTGQILISSNDPDNTSFSVPCTLLVGMTSVDDENLAGIPEVFTLSQNYPNPFNPTTEISFGLPVTGHTTLDVYDIMGRKVKTLINEELTAGFHQVTWDSADESGDKIASGVYFYKLAQGDKIITRKMVMLK